MIAPIVDVLARQALLGRLPTGDVDALAACARGETFDAGAVLACEGEPADRFYVVVTGRLALELHAPTGPLRIETRGPGDIVGWSWRFAPHHWTLDVVALDPTEVLRVDAAGVERHGAIDPDFIDRLTEQFAYVLLDRLAAARLRLLDLYGTADAG